MLFFLLFATASLAARSADSVQAFFHELQSRLPRAAGYGILPSYFLSTEEETASPVLVKFSGEKKSSFPFLVELKDLLGVTFKQHQNASHPVFEIERAGLFFKQLNGKDEYPENEFICRSLFEALGISELIVPTALIEMRHSDLTLRCQVSPAVGVSNLSEANKKKPISPTDYGQHFIMTLLLSLGDGKNDNYRVTETGRIISIDNEMILQDHVRYYTGQGAISGFQSGLFSEKFRGKFEISDKIDDDTRTWFKSIKEITPQQKMEEILSVLKSLMNKDPLPKEGSILLEWIRNIMKFDETYKFLESQKSKEELWWKFLQVYSYFDLVQQSFKDINLTYDALFEKYNEQIKNYFDKTEAKSGCDASSKRMKDTNTGLQFEGKEKLREKLWVSFFININIKKELLGQELEKLEIPLAKFILGLMYEYKILIGDPIPLYEKAALKDGCFYAQNRLCRRVSPNGALKFFESKEAQKTTKNFQLLYFLGKEYEEIAKKYKKTNDLYRKNMDNAIFCYTKAAYTENFCAKERTGNYNAQYCLGEIYQKRLSDIYYDEDLQEKKIKLKIKMN